MRQIVRFPTVRPSALTSMWGIVRMAILLSLLVISGFAQDAPPLVTDRPDQTESAATVPAGWIQIESGLVLEKQDRIYGSDAAKLLTAGVNGTLVRIGVIRNLEIRISTQLAYERTCACSGIQDDFFGFSGAGVGVKVRLAGPSSWLPETAILVNIDLPVGDLPVCRIDHLSDKMEAGVIVAAAHKLNLPFGLAYNLGAVRTESGDWLAIFSSAAGFELSEQVGAFVEVYGSDSPDAPADVFVDAGATVLVRPNVQLDVSVGVALTDSAPQWFVSTGVTIRLPR